MIRTLFKRKKMERNPYPRPRSTREYTRESLLAALRRDVKTWNTQWSNIIIRRFGMIGLIARSNPAYRDEYCYWAWKLEMIKTAI